METARSPMRFGSLAIAPLTLVVQFERGMMGVEAGVVEREP